MTATVSDVLAAADGAAAAGGSASPEADSATGVRARVRDARATRASVPITQRIATTIVADVSGAWVWRESPPALRQVIAGLLPAVDRVPAGSRPLRAGWVVWNASVAVPATAFLYVLAWVLQHPARAGVLAVMAGPIALAWITK
jgi:hypothetical protein